MICRVCGNTSKLIGTYTLLGNYDIKYYKCQDCLFIQTEEPFWLDQAYSSAITKSDIGLIQRNVKNVPTVKGVIEAFFNPERKFLDYAGGYGIFTRLMRDIGYDYYRQDIFCDNLFAEFFDLHDTINQNFELLTAFEVFEHFSNPQEEFLKMIKFSRNIFFTTTLYPENMNLFESNWDYLAPETGQHIAFYSKKTLAYIAKKNNLNFATNGSNYHLFSKNKINLLKFKLLCSYRTRECILRFQPKRKSLLLSDYERIRNL